ncbi:MAG TPA: hypothetical protein VLE27_17235 [Thermoanaerobaculia bacterium]|nr:hypothetical protein [Thermoanaerobaculia bacterium]
MTWKQHLLLAAVVIPLAVWARWNGAAEPKGARFHPWPDTVEYAAEAQALARSGQVYLQIGPHRVRPRYPPGWPLLLAPAIRLGVEGQNLWRVTALFGAGLAWLLGFLAARATGSLFPGLFAGCVWALAPIGVDLGQTLMSDEPTALVSIAGLALAGAGFLRKDGAGTLALLAGLAFGLAASMRSVAALLMVPPLAVFLLGGLRRLGTRPLLRRATLWGLGAAIFPALVILIQLRSGWPPFQWSGYSFWMPARYGDLASTFGLDYALKPDTTFRQEIQGRPISHLELALRVLLGLPGLGERHYLGLFWPIAGWLAAIPLYRAAKRRWDTAPWIALALLLWTVGHVAVFSLYFYPASRFYLGPLALCLVLLACGLGTVRGKIPAAVAAALILLLTVWGFLELRNEPSPASLRRERTRAKFTRWLQIGDEKRAHRTMPFDPVHAQALGLLTPEVAAQVQSWGELPDTVHVRRLRANGTL